MAHAGSEEITKSKFESRPSMGYKLREDGIQSQILFWLQVPEGSSKLLWPNEARNTVSLSFWDLP